MSKLTRLRDNIAALKYALTGEGDKSVLNKYTGFGGMTFVLNPLDRPWIKSDQIYIDDTIELHTLLRGASSSEREYDAWVESLKASTLTAYYTPEEVVTAIMEAIYGMKSGYYDKGICPKNMLDPAAGMGVFGSAAKMAALGHCNSLVKLTSFEKDILTATMLKAKQREEGGFVYCDGFEHFPKDELGTFDLVATNVPFGNISVFDEDYTNSKDAVRRDAAKMIHRYYVLKGLDCLRNGGIEAYIITSNYLNRDSDQLAEALKSARLIGAYRLANNLFKESGTEVGTDLLVLQKEEGRAGLTADESMLLTTYEDGGCPTNMYFQCYPDHVIATSTERDTDAYGKPGFVYSHKDGVAGIANDMAKVLGEDMKNNCDVTLFENRSQKKAKAEKKEEPKMDAETSARFMFLTAISYHYHELYDYEQKEQEENADCRKRLNDTYDGFVEKFGYLNKEVNARVIKKLNLHDLLALEIRDEQGRWQKADIMLRPIAFSTEELHGADTPQEALAQSLNDYGRPDMKYMSAMTGMDDDELLEALDGEVFYNPLNGEYEIKAKFICGNVIEKLETIKKRYPELDMSDAREGDLTEYRSDEKKIVAAMSALQAAIPTPIPFEDLDFNLGERWVDPKVYGDFASEFFSMPENPDRSWQGGKVEITVKYQPLIDQYAVEKDRGNQKIYTQYAVKSEVTDLDGMDLLVHALQNTCPKMMRYIRDSRGRKMQNDRGDYLKEEDHEKTQLANTKVEEIRQGYADWLQRQSREFKEHLADIYNRKFNCFVKPKYDGSHQTFPGIDLKGLEKKYGIRSIYQSQKDCVWMLLLNGGGICDHEVGSGKTLIMCIAAHEMKRLGMCHKPMIIGLKANVSAIAETYRTAYPEAKVLFAREADYSGQNRIDFFNKMKNNDWDCVIMSHDQFGRIPQSDRVQMELMREEVSQIEESLKAVNGWGWQLSSRVRRGLEQRKRNMEAKILGLQNDIRKKKDDVTDFDLLGIDHIFVDESHQFKNLGFSSRHDRVAGMGNTEGSKRAYNLLMAIRTIQRKTGRDLGATFLSGTTVTNSLTELYSLFRYLRPKALAAQGISCFDAWAAIFTKKSQEFEFSITNQIVLKERFRYFIKVPELAMFYNEITDFRTAEDVGIERPAKHAMLLNIKPTPDQEEFIKRLMKFAQSGDFSLIGIDCPTDKQQKAKMLYATDMARKMSLDMRLIDAGYADHPRNKASKCAQLIKRYYDQYDEQKGTQLVFSDLSTYQGDGKWNVYEEIKRKLVDDYGIPAREIRFIQECKCDSKKQQLIKDVNDGKVRVLFGSTSMLGTGVNAQHRVVAVHHLDTPWRPSDLEQRDGRAIRKGNEIAKLYADNKVDIIIYAVERSLDSYKFNLLHCKQTFINQLKRGQLDIRTLDEGSFDENTGMNFSEYMAILSGNTDLLERAKLEKKIAALESEKKNFYRDKREQEDKRSTLQKQNELYAKHCKDAQADYDLFLERKRADKDGFVANDIVIDGFTVPEGLEPGSDEWKKAVGERLLQLDRNVDTSDAHIPVGSIYGFRLLIRTVRTYPDGDGRMVHDNKFSVEGTGSVKHTWNDGYLNHASARTSAEFPLKALMAIPERIDGWKRLMQRNSESIAQLDSILGIEWGREADLQKLRGDLAILDRKINSELTRTRNQTTSARPPDFLP